MIGRMIICCLLCSLNAAQEQEPIDSLITQASKPSLMERLHQAQQYLDDKAKAKVEPSTGPTSGFNVVVGNMSQRYRHQREAYGADSRARRLL